MENCRLKRPSLGTTLLFLLSPIIVGPMLFVVAMIGPHNIFNFIFLVVMFALLLIDTQDTIHDWYDSHLNK